MDDELVPTVAAENHELEQSVAAVQAESQLAPRAVLIEVGDLDGFRCRAYRVVRLDAVLERRLVDLHDT